MPKHSAEHMSCHSLLQGKWRLRCRARIKAMYISLRHSLEAGEGDFGTTNQASMCEKQFRPKGVIAAQSYACITESQESVFVTESLDELSCRPYLNEGYYMQLSKLELMFIPNRVSFFKRALHPCPRKLKNWIRYLWGFLNPRLSDLKKQIW